MDWRGFPPWGFWAFPGVDWLGALGDWGWSESPYGEWREAYTREVWLVVYTRVGLMACRESGWSACLERDWTVYWGKGSSASPEMDYLAWMKMDLSEYPGMGWSVSGWAVLSPDERHGRPFGLARLTAKIRQRVADIWPVPSSWGGGCSKDKPEVLLCPARQ